MINRYIGCGLSLARIVRGLSLADLAIATGIEPDRLHRLEKGEEEFTAREMYMAAKVLCVPIDYFFDGVTAAAAIAAAVPAQKRPVPSLASA